jgi:hypothetical protein
VSRTVCRLLSVVTLASALFVLVGAVTASAASPTSVAWWSKLGVAPPTVPPGGLFVGNDPLGPTALSAVRVESNKDAVTLTLKVASGTLPPPSMTTIIACPIASPWQTPQGGHGDVTSAPQYDCSRFSKGMVATDNNSISWLLPALDVALVPDPKGQPVPFAVAFAPPDGNAVLLASGAPSAEATPRPPAAPAPADGLAPVAVGGGVIVRPSMAAATPAASPHSIASSASPSSVATAQPVGFPVPKLDDGSGQRLVAGLALAALAAAWWLMSNRPQREPRLLVARM